MESIELKEVEDVSSAIARERQSKQQMIEAIKDLGWTKEELRLIYSKMPEGTPPQEAYAFLRRARDLKLDPISGQIILQSHSVKSGEVKYSIITGVDGYRTMAMRSGLYAPGSDTKFDYDANGVLKSATVYVRRYHPDSQTWHESSATAHFEEYAATYYNRDSRQKELTPMWKKMGHTMLEKCAEVKALRRAFPAELGGIYAAEEMYQVNNGDADVLQAADVKGRRITAAAESKLQGKG